MSNYGHKYMDIRYVFAKQDKEHNNKNQEKIYKKTKRTIQNRYKLKPTTVSLETNDIEKIFARDEIFFI